MLVRTNVKEMSLGLLADLFGFYNVLLSKHQLSETQNIIMVKLVHETNNHDNNVEQQNKHVQAIILAGLLY